MRHFATSPVDLSERRNEMREQLTLFEERNAEVDDLKASRSGTFVNNRNFKWENRKHRVPLKEGLLWIGGEIDHGA